MDREELLRRITKKKTQELAAGFGTKGFEMGYKAEQARRKEQQEIYHHGLEDAERWKEWEKKQTYKAEHAKEEEAKVPNAFQNKIASIRSSITNRRYSIQQMVGEPLSGEIKTKEEALDLIHLESLDPSLFEKELETYTEIDMIDPKTKKVFGIPKWGTDALFKQGWTYVTEQPEQPVSKPKGVGIIEKTKDKVKGLLGLEEKVDVWYQDPVTHERIEGTVPEEELEEALKQGYRTEPPK